MSAKPLTTAELEVIRRLFSRGLTWDGYLSSRDCCTSLRDRGLAQYEFGFAWLTPEGEEIAIGRAEQRYAVAFDQAEHEAADDLERVGEFPIRGRTGSLVVWTAPPDRESVG